MVQILWTVLVLFVGGVLGVCLGPRYRGGTPVEATPAVVGRITELADLVVLRVPVSKVHVTRIGGYLGAVDCVVLVNGELEIGTDLKLARLEEVNAEKHTATLVLAVPTLRRARLNQNHSSIYRIDRIGLWKAAPFAEASPGVVNQAMIESQQCIESVGQETHMLNQAKAHSEIVIYKFLKALGWKVSLKWEGDTDDHR